MQYLFGGLSQPNNPDGSSLFFNLATKPLSAGIWSRKVVLDDSTEYRTRISLR